MRILFVSLAFVAAAAAAGAQGAPPPPADLARELHARYEGIRDFSAEFVHIYEGSALRRKATEAGTVQVKRPGKMRWTYTTPEEKLFVSDGVRIYSYIPADRQVIVSQMPEADEATTPVLFLVGKGNLVRDFEVSYAEFPDEARATYALKLVPKRPEHEYDWLILVVDRQSLQLRSLQAVDAHGGTSTFTFSNLRENVGLPDRLFTFSVPRGADVITTGTSG